MPRKKIDTPVEEEIVVQKTDTASLFQKPVRVPADEDILTINDKERAFTPQDTEEDKWNYLAGAAHRKKILSGIVSGLEAMETKDPICVVDYEGIRILIPAREMFLESWPEGEYPSRDFQMQIGRFLGATVSFLPMGVNVRDRAAVGSRRMAMLQQQEKYYETGRVRAGIRVACRVIGVGNNTITVEAVGVDSVIPSSQLAWEWFSDVIDLYAPGDLVVARVMAVAKDESTGRYMVRLSVKAATENPDLPVLRKLVPNSNYYGVVTGVKDRLIFIRLQVGVNAKTMTFRTREIPSKFDTVSFQVKSIDEEMGIAHGLVTRIIRKHGRPR